MSLSTAVRAAVISRSASDPRTRWAGGWSTDAMRHDGVPGHFVDFHLQCVGFGDAAGDHR
jgi:hypothetical protein